MPRATLNLQDGADLQSVNGVWRFAPGLVPGQPIEGVVSELEGTPARLPDFDEKIEPDTISLLYSLLSQTERAQSLGLKNHQLELFSHLAAKGVSGTVSKATGFIAGEEGPERINIVPLNDPSVKMDGINKLHDDRMASQGTPSINVVTSSQVNNSTDQSHFSDNQPNFKFSFLPHTSFLRVSGRT